MRQRLIRAWLIVAAVGIARVTTGAAQDVPVPVDVQVPLFLKILAFDRNLLRRGAGELVIGVLYQGRFRTSADVADKVRRALEAQPVRPAGITRLRVVALDLDHTPSLGAALDRQGVSVLYVSPLRAVDVGQVTGATRPGRITSLTGSARLRRGGPVGGARHRA